MSLAGDAIQDPALQGNDGAQLAANPAKRGRIAGSSDDLEHTPPHQLDTATGDAIASAVTAALTGTLPSLMAQIAASVRDQLRSELPVQPVPPSTPAPDPSLKLAKQIEDLVSKSIDSLVNKLRALNVLRFDEVQQKKAYADLDADNPAQPLPEAIQPHLRHISKPLKLHGKGGHRVKDERQQAADKLARQYLSELLLIEIGNIEDLIVEHVTALNEKRAKLLSDISSLFDDTSIPSEVRSQQIAAAGKSFDEQSAKTTLKVELERKAALQLLQEKKATLAQKKLEKLQLGEATSITAISRRIANEEFEKRVAAAEGADDDNEMSDVEDDVDELERLEGDAAKDAAIRRGQKKPLAASTNKQSPKNGKAAAGKSPTARSSKKANRGAGAKKRAGKGGGKGAR